MKTLYRIRFFGPQSDNRKSKIKNLKFGVVVGALLLALCFPAEAQQPKKVYRIGYLSSTDRASDAMRFEAFRAALRELGYTDRENVIIEKRYAEGKRDRQPELAAELVRLKVEIIVISGGGTVIRAAMNATKTIPILMTGQGGDPVKEGYVGSLARPAGNVTGFSSLRPN
jgi:putative ABC transport system substrate-binding protein